MSSRRRPVVRAVSPLAHAPPRAVVRQATLEALSAADGSLRPPPRAFDDAALVRSTEASCSATCGSESWRGPIRYRRSRGRPGRARTAVRGGRAGRRPRVDLLGRVGWSSAASRLAPRSQNRPPLALVYAGRLDYVNIGEPSDVKLPWEISRAQWLLPAGQAYVLGRDDGYAEAVRDTLTDWIGANPYALGPNWAMAMEPALRIFSWTWLLRACGKSTTFADHPFRSVLLRLSISMAGSSRGTSSGRTSTGTSSPPTQPGLSSRALLRIRPETRCCCGRRLAGPDRRAASAGLPGRRQFRGLRPYHRLITSLFLLPALYRRRLGSRCRPGIGSGLGNSFPVLLDHYPGGTDVANARRQRRSRHFQSGGGGSAIIDLPSVVPDWDDAGAPRSSRDRALRSPGCSGPRRQSPYLTGRDRVPSPAFPAAGLYVLRSHRSHIVVDCGPVASPGEADTDTTTACRSRPGSAGDR